MMQATAPAESGASGNILELEGVGKRFSGVTALDGVSFAVRRGEIHGVCGENGAGKSTLMKIIAGVHPAGSYEGRVIYDGSPLELGRDAIRRARQSGIALVHQELALVPGLSVAANIYLGREPGRLGLVDRRRMHAEAAAVLERYGLDLNPADRVGDLAVGRQQMVEIARALAGEARLIILDEPTSALTEAESAALVAILRRLRDAGRTCLYISHRLEELFAITDRISVLRDGGLVGTVDTAATGPNELVAMMVGRELTERFPPASRRPGPVILEVEGLAARDPERGGREVVSGVSFALRQGEILGVAGLMGSGRSELAGSLFGLYGKRVGGRIKLEGKPIAPDSPRTAMALGLSLVPEDRKRLGLVTGQSILKNISLPNLGRFAGFASVNKHRELMECAKAAADLAVKAPSLGALVESLSGGNQQKVVMAKWLLARPKVLILDEPTRGIDVGAKYEIYKIMDRLAADGVAVIMISSELPEVLGMSDRVLVMRQGRQAGILERAAADQEKIMALATGAAELPGGRS